MPRRVVVAFLAVVTALATWTLRPRRAERLALRRRRLAFRWLSSAPSSSSPPPSSSSAPPAASSSPPPPAEQPPAGALTMVTMKDLNFAKTYPWPRGCMAPIDNISMVQPGHFKFVLRHRGACHDGDRDGKNNAAGMDKSRAEIYGCGRYITPFEHGSTWLIGTSVRVNADFVPSRGYCNIMQPVNHQSFLTISDLQGDTLTAQLNVFRDGVGTPITTARRFTFRRGEWVALVVKVKFGRDGYYALSVNGDAFQGAAMDTSKTGDRTFPVGGNFGIYGNFRGVRGLALTDWVVEHRNMYLKHLDGPGPRK